jgi:hypothetical protein
VLEHLEAVARGIVLVHPAAGVPDPQPAIAILQGTHDVVEGEPEGIAGLRPLDAAGARPRIEQHQTGAAERAGDHQPAVPESDHLADVELRQAVGVAEGVAEVLEAPTPGLVTDQSALQAGQPQVARRVLRDGADVVGRQALGISGDVPVALDAAAALVDPRQSVPAGAHPDAAPAVGEDRSNVVAGQAVGVSRLVKVADEAPGLAVVTAEPLRGAEPEQAVPILGDGGGVLVEVVAGQACSRLGGILEEGDVAVFALVVAGEAAVGADPQHAFAVLEDLGDVVGGQRLRSGPKVLHTAAVETRQTVEGGGEPQEPLAILDGVVPGRATDVEGKFELEISDAPSRGLERHPEQQDQPVHPRSSLARSAHRIEMAHRLAPGFAGQGPPNSASLGFMRTGAPRAADRGAKGSHARPRTPRESSLTSAAWPASATQVTAGRVPPRGATPGGERSRAARVDDKMPEPPCKPGTIHCRYGSLPDATGSDKWAEALGATRLARTGRAARAPSYGRLRQVRLPHSELRHGSVICALTGPESRR